MAHEPKFMSQYFPIPPEIFARACEMVSGRVSRLPFLRRGVNVTGELVGVAMESLNAVPKRALALSSLQGPAAKQEDGLDRCIEERLHILGRHAAPVIAEVLTSAGIAEPALIPDRQSRHERRGVRLVAPWTWHIASVTAPSLLLGGIEGDDPSLSWMDICPVCRTGTLSRVTGKQLFGIPRTEYFIECSSCGAKFIPVGPAYRLASIAVVRDPLWKRYLNETRTRQQWSALARGPGSGSSGKKATTAEPPSCNEPAPHGILPVLKDGSVAVPAGERTLYFRPVGLRFSGGVKEGAFTRVQVTLGELLSHPAYRHLQDSVNVKYSPYIPLKTGVFLSRLRDRHDLFYREFLNPYGDEKFGILRVVDAGGTDRKGILLVLINYQIHHATECAEGIRSVINNRFGRVSPDDCLLSGDTLRCRINTLLCSCRNGAGLYAHPAESGDERREVLDALSGLIPDR